jgi:hypothetical protein
MKALSRRPSTDASTFDEKNFACRARHSRFSLRDFGIDFIFQHWRARISFSEFEFNQGRAELSGGDVEAHCDFPR